MIPNIEAFRSHEISYADLVKDISYRDLYSITDEFFASVQSIVADVKDADVVFVPEDVALQNKDEQGWPLAHVVDHFTATLEESASIAVTLARGISFDGRLRYEVPWEETHTAQQIQERLQESQRMCRAFLDAWPTTPHLDLTVTRIPHFGPLNAIGMYILGVLHGESHIEQLRDIMRQTKER